LENNAEWWPNKDATAKRLSEHCCSAVNTKIIPLSDLALCAIKTVLATSLAIGE
jgi:hypothetical protein